MKKFYEFFKKRGFTLAEALVVTILVGYIMVPIVGTMQNGILRTQNFNHREKLRTLAKSRLNKEVSFGAFDLKAIDTSPSYHYVYYNTATEPKLLTLDSHLASNSYIASDGSVLASAPASISAILYSYKTEIEIKENLEVESLSGVATYSGSLRGLKAIVVKSELEPNDNVVATESVSFFSLVNVPSFSEEFIWLANNEFLEIYSIDPISRTKVETFDVPKIDTSKPADDGAQDPNRPVHTVVHPNGKFLLIQGRHKLFALNINKASQYYGDFHEIYDRGDHISDVKVNDKNKAMDHKGIAIRPDGKRFFFAIQKDKTVVAYKITDAESWPPTLSSIANIDLKNDIPDPPGCDTDKYKDLVAGNDGWLYLALKDKKKAIRFPMYADYSKYGNMLPWQIDDNDLDGNGFGGDKEAWAIENSADGKDVYVLWKKGTGGYITRFDSKTLEITGRIEVNNNAQESKDFLFSADNKYWVFSNENDDAAKSGFYFWEHNPSSFDNLSTTSTVSTVNAFTEKDKTRNLLQSPVLTEVVADPEIKPNIYFIDYEAAENGDYTKANGGLPPTRISNITPYDESHVSMSARKQSTVAVGTIGVNNSIRFIDVYSSNEYKDRTIELATSTPTNIALSQKGAEAYISYDATRPGFTKTKTIFKAGDDPILSFSLGSADSYKVAISEDPDNPGLYANGEYDASTPGFNGYWIPGAPVPAGLPNDQCRDVDFTTNWKFQDIVAIPGGGFFILFKDSGTNDCTLDWIGKMEWGADKGKYKRFARWRTVTDGFPLANSISLAISPDGGLLAVEQYGSPQKVHLYDLNSCKFGHWTQLNGLIADYRTNDFVYSLPGAYEMNTQVAPNCGFSLPAPTLNTGRNLASCTTSADCWRSHQDYPGNYYTNGGTNNGIASNDDRNDAVKRFFGYYIPENSTSKFGIAQRDPYQFFLNKNLLKQSANAATNASDEQVTPCTALTKYKFQLNHKTNTGERLVGIFTRLATLADIDPGSLSVANSGGDFDDEYNEMSGFDEIASTSFRPFQFVPFHIAGYDLTGCNNDTASAMVFSRDTSDPVLFFLDSVSDAIWAIKIGYPATKIDLSSGNMTDNQLAVSNDGGVLIYAREDTKTVHFIDISEPNSSSDSFDFDGSTYIQTAIASGFGHELNTAPLDATPNALATLPFNRYSSALPDGNYKSVATMPFSIAGCNNAAVASGGIYIMAGASGLGGTPTNDVLVFKPHENPGTNVADHSTGVLNRAVRLHSTAAYDDKIYLFNGYATDTSGPIAWAQSYNVETGQARSSWDTPTTTTEIRVNKYMSSDTNPAPTEVTFSAEYTTREAYKAFDGSVGSTDIWLTTTSNEWVKYDTGSDFLRIIVNKIWLNNDISTYCGVKDYVLEGSNDDATWTTIGTGTVSTYNDTNYSKDFISNTTPYRYFKFTVKTNHGDPSWWGVREIKFFHENIRRVSPIMTSNTSGGVTVSASAENQPAYQAFDNGFSDSDEWDTGGGGAHWLKMDLGSPDNVNIIGFYNSDDGVASFSLSASNDDSFYTPIPLVSGDFQGQCPDDTGWQYFYFTNTSDYQYYKLDFPDSWGPDSDLEPWEIRFFSTQTTPPATEPVLTKTMNDNRGLVKLEAGAACTTPYGIVIAGGLDHTGNATTSAMVYWPHATDYYNSATDQQWGICSSLPPLPQPTANHCLVWHKGKLYRVGGNDNGSLISDALTTVDIFDFETNSWSSQSPGTSFTDRNLAGACSLGDEIFIFGGRKSGGLIRTDAAAWNPEINKTRLLSDIPLTSGSAGLNLPHTLGVTAVPYGPYIYLIGGSLPTSTSVGKEIIRFSP